MLQFCKVLHFRFEVAHWFKRINTIKTNNNKRKQLQISIHIAHLIALPHHRPGRRQRLQKR